MVAWDVAFMIICYDASPDGHASDWSLAIHSSVLRLVACMVACVWCLMNDGVRGHAASLGGHASDWSLAIYFNAQGWSLAWSLVYRDTWKSRTALGNRPDKRLVACRTFYIRKSRSLVTCFFIRILMYMYLFLLPDAKVNK